MSKRIFIFSNVSVFVSDAMLEMLEYIDSNIEIKFDSVDAPQKKLLKEMHERNLLLRQRKNNEVSYKVRPNINWR
jgi:hypothetical protein